MWRRIRRAFGRGNLGVALSCPNTVVGKINSAFLLSFICKASYQISAAPSGKRNAKNVNAFPGAGPNR